MQAVQHEVDPPDDGVLQDCRNDERFQGKKAHRRQALIIIPTFGVLKAF